MVTRHIIHISGELYAELAAKAAEEGKTVDELAEDVLRKGLDDRAWQDLLAYGSERRTASGYTAEGVPDLVREWRREQRGR